MGGRRKEGGRDHERHADLDQCEWYVVDLPLEHAHMKNNHLQKARFAYTESSLRSIIVYGDVSFSHRLIVCTQSTPP